MSLANDRSDSRDDIGVSLERALAMDILTRRGAVSPRLAMVGGTEVAGIVETARARCAIDVQGSRIVEVKDVRDDLRAAAWFAVPFRPRNSTRRSEDRRYP